MTDDINNIHRNSLQPKYLYIKNWRQFQHYKHRNPPWIKLHCQTVRSADWLRLDEPSRLLMLVCMMIAPEYGGKVPANPAFIKKLGFFRKTPNLKPLINCGFLVETLADASDMQADASKVLARVETETETETETEKKVSILGDASPSAQPKNVPRETKKGTSDGSRGSRLPEGWLPSPEVHLFAVGLVGEAGTAEQLDRFRDYWHGKAGSAARKVDWDKTFKNWCRTAKERKGNGNGQGRFSAFQGTSDRPLSPRERTVNALQRLKSCGNGEPADFGVSEHSDKRPGILHLTGGRGFDET